MFTDLIMAGGWVFWSLLAAVMLFEVVLLWNDQEDTPVPVVVALLALTAAVLLTNAFAGVTWQQAVLGACGYVVLGVLWSIKKWYDFVVSDVSRVRDTYKKYANKDQYKTFEDYAKDKQPTAAENKQRIVTWMTLWPFSFTWWCLTWPRRAFSWIYDRLSTLYDRVATSVWEKLVKK